MPALSVCNDTSSNRIPRRATSASKKIGGLGKSSRKEEMSLVEWVYIGRKIRPRFSQSQQLQQKNFKGIGIKWSNVLMLNEYKLRTGKC